MTTRITGKDVERAAETLTAAMHDRGEMHPDARIVVGGEYGRTTVEVTGGPHLGTGVMRITSGTKRECAEVLWGAARIRECGRRTFGRTYA